MKDPGKIPPQAIDVEEILIGELIQFPDHIDDVADILSVEDFYNSNHKLIYDQIQSLWIMDKKIDLVIVTNKLKESGKLENVGGSWKITKMLEKAIHPQMIKDHALIIKEKSIQRKFIKYGITISKLAYQNDVDQLVNESSDQLSVITDSIYQVKEADSFQLILNDTVDQYYKQKEKAKKGSVTGAHTPLFDLNKITGGWQPGDLIVLAGRPSMGKTAFAVQCGVAAARMESAIQIFTLEMSDRQFTQRLLACIDDVSIENLRTGTLDPAQEKQLERAVNKLQDLPINIDDKPGITAEYIKARSSAAKRKGKCDLIIVDYLQLMAYDQKLNANDGLGSITRKLKGLAKDLDVPVILLSQLSRKCEERGNKRPVMADVRSSGEIEQDADMIIFLYRHHYYSGQDEDQGNLELIIAKNRNGRTGTIDASHNETITKIFDKYEGQKEPKPAEDLLPF